MALATCTTCKAEIPPEAGICSQCGTPQPERVAEVPSHTPPPITPRPGKVKAAGREEPATNARERKCFIELRAEGRTYADIGAVLSMPKPMLLAWGREFRQEIENARELSRTKKHNGFAAEEHAQMTRLGATHKKWLILNDGLACMVCRKNAGQGFIPMDKPFLSGHQMPGAHVGCAGRCIVEYDGFDVEALFNEGSASVEDTGS